ncbi:MAG: hypothetical protein HGA37_12730 [Lentimicrobium sp.]|nr:hypothetical protein [Lentimicrobium sp.]
MQYNLFAMTLRNLLLTLLIFAGISANAQYFNYGYNPYTGGAAGLSAPLLSYEPARFNLQTGASFSTGYGGGSLFNTYLAPSFSKDLGKKFTISAGAVINNTTFNNTAVFNQEGQLSAFSGNLTTMTLFTSGSFKVNDKLTLSGSAYKTINPAFNARLNPQSLQMEAQGMSFGIGYKVSENVHIGAEIRMQQGNGNLYSPYGNSFGNPYQSGFYGY